MKYLRKLADGFPIDPILCELEGHPQLWNQHKLRTTLYGPHNTVADIWVRYRPFHELRHVGRVPMIHEFVNEPHESAWYPAIDALPSLRSGIFEIMRYFEVERLGGVLITKIPPGGTVQPHIDRGWHASYYEKIALQLKCAPGQVFCFADGEFECAPGTLYAFDNSQEHWVSNRSDRERITAIICVRRDQRLKPLSASLGD